MECAGQWYGQRGFSVDFFRQDDRQLGQSVCWRVLPSPATKKHTLLPNGPPPWAPPLPGTPPTPFIPTTCPSSSPSRMWVVSLASTSSAITKATRTAELRSITGTFGKSKLWMAKATPSVGSRSISLCQPHIRPTPFQGLPLYRSGLGLRRRFLYFRLDYAQWTARALGLGNQSQRTHGGQRLVIPRARRQSGQGCAEMVKHIRNLSSPALTFIGRAAAALSSKSTPSFLPQSIPVMPREPVTASRTSPCALAKPIATKFRSS